MKNIIRLSLLLVMLTIAAPEICFAHKVTVFAWVEDGTIYTQSSFGGKRKAKNCKINIADKNGGILDEGMTDGSGEYAFKIPENVNSDLTITLEAGSGHKAHWRLPYSEISTPKTKDGLASAMEKKENLEKGPPLINIFAGLGIIFLLAAIIKWINMKKAKR